MTLAVITVFTLLPSRHKKLETVVVKELVSINTLFPESQAPLPPPGFHLFYPAKHPAPVHTIT